MSITWPRRLFRQGSAETKLRRNLLTLREGWQREKFASLKNGLEGWVFIGLGGEVGFEEDGGGAMERLEGEDLRWRKRSF